MRIVIVIVIAMGASNHYACGRGERRRAKRYKCGCNLLFLPSLSQKLHPELYRLAKQNSLHNFITQTKVETPM